ncbi:MAG TPA: hypothetical protein VEJ84_02215 [Acidimicrobiales bacterium]|nr:hypothetical protein [Acidimicrobiales bacterium]
MTASWQAFFSAQVTVGAALTGLVFVALSINLKQILSHQGLAGRAGEALLVLLVPVFAGLAGVLPQTSLGALGAEILAISLIAWSAVSAIILRGHQAMRARPWNEYLTRVVGAQAAVLPGVVAGGLLLAGDPTGLWWQAAGVAACIAVGVGDAWVLLVEILR